MTSTTQSSSAPATATPEQIAERVRGVAPALARNALASEERRSVHPETIEALRDAGLFRILLPRRVGGYELTFPTMVDAVSTAAQACSAGGWVLAVLTAHDWMLGMFPDECQDEVYAEGPDALVAGGLATQGKAQPVEGGWRVSGRWQFGSGCDHATWFIAGAELTTSTPQAPKHVHVILPAADVAIDDTWFTLGLRGTGSKDLVIDNAFVPEHRSLATGTLFGGRSEAAARQATKLYRTPVLAGLALHIAAASLGIARSAYDRFVEQTKSRKHAYTGELKSGVVGTQMRIAEASAELRSAELLLADLCVQLDAVAASDDRVSLETRAWTKWQAAYATQLCRRAVERIYAAAGARGIFDSSALQQAFRDINTGTHHATLDPDDAAETVGRLELGLSAGTFIL